MKRLLIAAAAAAAALVIAGVVGGAGAQTPTVPGAIPEENGVHVTGVGYGGMVRANARIPARYELYRSALNAAMDDAKAKADAIAAKAGLRLTKVTSVQETSSMTSCGLGEEDPIAEAAIAAAKRRRPAMCPVEASVTVSYESG